MARQASADSALEAPTSVAFVGALIAAGFAAAVGQRSRRSATKVRRACDGTGIVYRGERAPNKFEPWVAPVLETGTITADLTEEELQQWLVERSDQLKKMVPSSEEDFQDEVDELTWAWRRPLLPFVDPQRMQMAKYKRRTIMRQKKFFESVRLFKPLAMKYPTLLRRFLFNPSADIENNKMKINPDFIYKEEKIAGFTYEDFLAETSGCKFDKWDRIEVGDVVEGKVVSFSKDGAFVEVGAKSWAFMPLKNISFAPIGTPQEALSIGQVVEAEVQELDAESATPGDAEAKQVILSRTVIEKAKAWEQVEAIMRGDADVDKFLLVNVKALTQVGAVVQSESGLEGFIRRMELSDKADDPRIVGTWLKVEVKEINKDIFDAETPPYGQYYIYFSYANAATKELASNVNEYDILDGVVESTTDAIALVRVGSAVCKLKKLDVSGSPRPYSLKDAFKDGEELKVVVLSVSTATGEVRLGTRPLEPRKGMMLTDRKKCFEMAETTVAKFKEFAEKQKLTITGRLNDELGNIAAKKPEKPSGGNILGDMDDEDMSDGMF